MAFEDLRRSVEGEIFDYPMLMHHLREYKKPRDKVSLLLKENAIIRIKKGLYTFGPMYQRGPVPLEVLANLIYSPSYISLEYALSRYKLIPERAFSITSISLKRSTNFKTPVGSFVYKIRPPTVYPLGITWIALPHTGSYLIAEPEKALVDLISQVKHLEEVSDMRDHLYENMRMEQSDLAKLNRRLLSNIVCAYGLPDTLIRAIYD